MSQQDRNRELGAQFEADMERDLGLERVPGSGNQWHAKLDNAGFGMRLSLKATFGKNHPIDVALVDEMRAATGGLGGTGEIPALAIRLNADPRYDLIVIGKDDWIRVVQEGMKLAVASKAEAKVARARTPILLREEDDA